MDDACFYWDVEARSEGNCQERGVQVEVPAIATIAEW
jgi:hypothetical protein